MLIKWTFIGIVLGCIFGPILGIIYYFKSGEGSLITNIIQCFLGGAIVGGFAGFLIRRWIFRVFWE